MVMTASLNGAQLPTADPTSWERPHKRSLQNAATAQAYMDRVRVDIKERWSDLHERLTPSQMAVLALCAHGLSDVEVARILGVGKGTVGNHRAQALDRMHLSYWTVHRGAAIAAYWAWRETRLSAEAGICDSDTHCHCADILEGIGDA